ncbi:hypothetical protein R3X28_19280, partial [Maribacter sp. TH_r10]|uniref:hypothetical protein n=1 Tax=Maribacter sp. TH_r10 TaxID=3082086 RepID=UPI00295372CD
STVNGEASNALSLSSYLDNTDEQDLLDFQVNGSNLEISIENGNTVSVPLADITTGVDTNTVITSYAIDATDTNLVITDSESNTFSVAIADIAALVDTDTQYTAGNGLNLNGSNVFTAVVDPA